MDDEFLSATRSAAAELELAYAALELARESFPGNTAQPDLGEAAQSEIAKAYAALDAAREEFASLLRQMTGAGVSYQEVRDALPISRSERPHLTNPTTRAAPSGRLPGPGDSLWVKLACSFCGSTQPPAKMLVAGSDAQICPPCIHRAREVIAGGGQPGTAHTGLSLVPRRAVGPHLDRRQTGDGEQTNTGYEKGCSFCGQDGGPGRSLVGGNNAAICSDCLDFCREMMP